MAEGTVVELRVHGVSGTPPEALLGCPVEFCDQVAGNKSAGFYRRQPWIDVASADRSAPWPRVTEAYSWGGLTSGPASRAVWLLFLPFIFVNLAHWMLPPATARRRAAAVAVALLRLLALSFTLTLMLAAAVAVMDVLVWQCAALDYCRTGPVSAVAALPRGVQVAAGTLPLIVVIVVLWRLGRETLRDAGRPPHPAVMADEVPLESDTFWCADASVLRLRACHVMAWTAGLTALALAVPARHGVTSGVRAVTFALLAASGVILAVAVVATAWNRATARGGVGADRLTRPLLLLRWISLVLLAVSLVWVASNGPADVSYPVAPTHYPGLRGAIYAVLGVQVVLLVALFVSTGLSMRGRVKEREQAWRPTLGGFTGPFVALIGWLIGGGFSVGVGLWTAQTFGDAVMVTATARDEIDRRAAVLDSATAGFGEKAAALDAEAPLIVPPPYFWAAMAVAVSIVAAALVAAALWWLTRRRARTELRSVLADHPGTAPDDRRAGEVARSRALASVTDVGVAVVGGLAVFAVLLVAVFAAWYLSDRGGYESLPGYSPTITRASVFITLTLATGLIAVAVQAYRNRQMRRVVGVLWDVITFWPRANHPLTPPCYAERTVPELLGRLETLTAQPDTRVVLAAHSQGTVIAAAALLQHNGDTGAALMTFGSPLRRLYARNFPAYFGTGALPRLCQRQRPRWINLWALSDPIGSWVNDGGSRGLPDALTDVDYRLLDVESLVPRSDGTYAPICGHSGFWVRPEYREATALLETTLLPEGTPTDASVLAPPSAQAL